MNKKVVIGLSGGVDSSVAAYLLKQQGYDVTGLFMINWHDTTGTLSGDCPWEDDRVFAELVARKLDIPFQIVDLSEHYRKRVVDYMFAEYEKGRTPNPDVLCNREVKFDVFAKAAFDLGADYIATGHYARCEEVVIDGEIKYRLLAGVDGNKDQSYFLCQLSQQQLSTALFPIGHLEKPEVRKIADQLGLPTAQRKDSQGICFVGKVDLPTFLQQKLQPLQGKIIEIMADADCYKQKPDVTDLNELAKPCEYLTQKGKFVGLHKGAHYYTIGQRKGINIGGKEKPLYVIGTDTTNNVLYVGQGDEHPGLYRKALKIDESDIHWIRPDLRLNIGESNEYMVRIRYRQPLQEATLIKTADGLLISFEHAQRSITAGQFAAWYNGDELIGSGVITE